MDGGKLRVMPRALADAQLQPVTSKMSNFIVAVEKERSGGITGEDDGAPAGKGRKMGDAPRSPEVDLIFAAPNQRSSLQLVTQEALAGR